MAEEKRGIHLQVTLDAQDSDPATVKRTFLAALAKRRDITGVEKQPPTAAVVNVFVIGMAPPGVPFATYARAEVRELCRDNGLLDTDMLEIE